MTLCTIAIVADCKKCPAFAMCPLKAVIGDVPKASDPEVADANKKWVSRSAEVARCR